MMLNLWRDVTVGDGSIGPKWIPRPELKSYEVETRLLISEGCGIIARAYNLALVCYLGEEPAALFGKLNVSSMEVFKCWRGFQWQISSISLEFIIR
jgi:hypothetical protein